MASLGAAQSQGVADRSILPRPVRPRHLFATGAASPAPVFFAPPIGASGARFPAIRIDYSMHRTQRSCHGHRCTHACQQDQTGRIPDPAISPSPRRPSVRFLSRRPWPRCQPGSDCMAGAGRTPAHRNPARLGAPMKKPRCGICSGAIRDAGTVGSISAERASPAGTPGRDRPAPGCRRCNRRHRTSN